MHKNRSNWAAVTLLMWFFFPPPPSELRVQAPHSSLSKTCVKQSSLQSSARPCYKRTCAWVTHIRTNTTGTPEPLTEPVFPGNLAKSLPVGLPSSEEVDRAVLPALDHLHRPREREKESERRSWNGIHRAYAVFDPPLRALSHPPGRALPLLIWN